MTTEDYRFWLFIFYRIFSILYILSKGNLQVDHLSSEAHAKIVEKAMQKSINPDEVI
jgi:hypothetical protein